MTSSIIETQECIQMEEIYDHIYFKLEKDRIKKELLEKENKEKERIIKIKEKWDEVFTLDHKFYFNKRS
jgi:galactose-1-phosphate uridylyltransferase